MRLFELTEGRYDPHTHKAIFMLGGPGSGKTYVAKKLTGHSGLRHVNVDEFYEMLRNKQGIQGRGFDTELYRYSGSLSQKKLDLLLKGRIGIVVDGTGRKVQRLSEIKEQLEASGYDTMAVFVNTDILTALDRNEQRRRKADTDWVRKVHAELQSKLGELQNIFGSNMLIVDNTEDRKDFSDAQKQIDKFLNAPNRRPVSWPINERFADEQEEADVYKTVADGLVYRASDYFREVGEPVPLMYRGYEKYSEEPFQRPFRDNREPKDSGLYHQDLYNLAIEAGGGTANRSNSIFVSGNMVHARKYGEVYVVFPMGDFNYTFHLGIKDWYDKLGNILEGIAPAYFEKFEQLVGDDEVGAVKVAKEIIAKKAGGQQLQMLAQIFLKISQGIHADMSLDMALDTDVEVLISARGGYYYIPFHHFFKYVKPYLENKGLRIADQPPRSF